MPLVTLDHVSIAFGHLPLLDDVSAQVDAGERVSVIGRNGTGKSTLLQIISGELAPDAGSVWRQPGVKIARLDQDVPLSTTHTVFEAVAEGLGELAALVSIYHRAAHEAARGNAAALQRAGELQHALEEKDGWRLEQRVEMVLNRLGLPPDSVVDTLSGGWRRRVLLARALVSQPDVLLLDEPTNHLDIESIEWLEAFLSGYAGAVVFVTHDRTFLQRLATRVIELDRGHLTSWPGDYLTFLRKKDEWLASEASDRERFDKKLAAEEAWLRQGVKARRTRDEGRVRALMTMREERAARRAHAGTARLGIELADSSGRMVFEARDVTKSFEATVVIRDFSTRIMRGDRVGLIGPNGVGKTTLLSLLVGDLQPEEGEIRRGTNVQIAYYDQQREQLDPERSVFDTIGEGNDTITVSGRSRHVNGYLRDFLFPAERARSQVKALSGGERNRLLLARLFTRPANVLVLDEPTNDLDLETLELLEAQLVEFPGTLLLVSHDRKFLDNVVTSTLVFEGDGRIEEYVGGYEDWARQAAGHRATDPGLVLAKQTAERPEKADQAPRRLTYKEAKELDAIPARIDALEQEQQNLNARVASADFYKEGAEAIKSTLARLAEIEGELLAAYERWDELEERREPQ